MLHTCIGMYRYRYGIRTLHEQTANLLKFGQLYTQVRSLESLKLIFQKQSLLFRKCTGSLDRDIGEFKVCLKQESTDDFTRLCCNQDDDDNLDSCSSL